MSSYFFKILQIPIKSSAQNLLKLFDARANPTLGISDLYIPLLSKFDLSIIVQDITEKIQNFPEHLLEDILAYLKAFEEKPSYTQYSCIDTVTLLIGLTLKAIDNTKQ